MRPAIAVAVFVLISGIYWIVAGETDDGPPESERHEVVPLGDPASAPTPELPPFDPDPDLPLPPPPTKRAPAETDNIASEREDMERLVEALAGGPEEIEPDEIREVLEEPLDPVLSEETLSPERVAQLQRSTRVRRQQSLDLVDMLLEQVQSGLATAEEEGNVDTFDWLTASQRRLGVRREALVRSIAELDAEEQR